MEAVLEFEFDTIFNITSDAPLKVEILELKKYGKNKYKTCIVFYARADYTSCNEDTEIVRIIYKFDLDVLSDEEVFQTIEYSIAELTVKVAEYLQLARLNVNSEKYTKEYIR